jgi:hypothetical protein
VLADASQPEERTKRIKKTTSKTISKIAITLSSPIDFPPAHTPSHTCSVQFKPKRARGIDTDVAGKDDHDALAAGERRLMDLAQEPVQLSGTALASGQLLPDVAFIDAQTGKQWRAGQLRQRSALVLCFMHADCEPCQDLLARLADREEDIRWADAQVRVVLPVPAASPFPVLVDQHGKAQSRMLGHNGQIPTLVVANRYTAVVEAYPAAGHDFPDLEQIIATLRVAVCDCS